MGLHEDYSEAVEKSFKDVWSVRDGKEVPKSEDLGMGNHAVKLEGTVLYADLDDSTHLVDAYKPEFAAVIYKAYLGCAAKVIRSEGGEITSYDGDRIMAVFIGDKKNSSAARSALKINYTVTQIINPLIKACYPNTDYCIRQAVGIDTSNLLVARTGIRGSNELVWVGRAANYAAKLCSSTPNYPSRLTEAVYRKLPESVKYGDEDRCIWKLDSSEEWNKIRVYRSTWRMAL